MNSLIGMGEKAGLGLVLFLGVALVPTFAGASEGTKDAFKRPEMPVYVVTENRFAEGFNSDSAKFGDLLAIELIPGKNVKRGSGAGGQFPVGHTLQLYSGGTKLGTIQVQKTVSFQCDSQAGVASAKPQKALEKGRYGLATEAKSIRPHDYWQRQPTEEEKTKVVHFIAERFKKETKRTAGKVEIRKIIATRLSKNGAPFLLGSVGMKEAVNQDEYFFILKTVTNGTLDSTLVIHGQSKDPVEGTDLVSHSFVDQLDLDGDGVDEIVIEVRGYESESYLVYKLNGKQWDVVWENSGAGC